MKLFLSFCLFSLFFLYYPASAKSYDCYDLNSNDEVSVSTYDDTYFYDPEYYRDNGYDHWLYRTFFDRETRSSHIRFIDNDDSCDDQGDYRGTSLDSCNENDIYYDQSDYDDYYYRGQYDSYNDWHDLLGPDQYQYSYNDPSNYGDYYCESNQDVVDSFENNGFDAWYRDDSGERTIRCVRQESYYETSRLDEYSDNYIICRAR